MESHRQRERSPGPDAYLRAVNLDPRVVRAIHGNAALYDIADRSAVPLRAHEHFIGVTQREKASVNGLNRVLRVVAIAEGLTDNRLDHRERIPHSMSKLVIEKLLLCFRLLSFRNVHERTDRAYDPAFRDHRPSPILDRKTRAVSPIEEFVGHVSVDSGLRGLQHWTIRPRIMRVVGSRMVDYLIEVFAYDLVVPPESRHAEER